MVREVLRKQYNCSPDIASLKALLVSDVSCVCVVECLVVVWSCGRASPPDLPLSFLYLYCLVSVCVCMFVFLIIELFSLLVLQKSCSMMIVQHVH